MNDRDNLFRDGAEGVRPEPSFVRRALIVVGLASAAVAVFLLLWQAAEVLLLLFAGVLFGVVLCGAAGWVSARAGLPYGWSLTAVVVALAAVLTGAGWFLGSEVADQFQKLAEQLPSSTDELQQRLRRYEWWPDSVQLPSAQQFLSRRGNLLGQITGAVSATLGAVVDALVILFVALFVAAQPETYRAGALHLVPERHRGRAGELLTAVGGTWRRWMVGRLVDMLVVGAVTTAGLYLLGTPVPLALGLLTFLLVFVPYLGPIVSAIPAVLVALTQGPMAALYVALLYLGIQTVESYLLQPIIQDRSVNLPPAVVLGGQLLLGVLVGTLGVMFATPLVAAAVVAVKLLYVRDALGDPIEVRGAPAPRPAGSGM